VNRYVAEGVLTDLFDGKNVLVLCADRGDIRSTQDNILAALDTNDLPGLKVRRANGAESISYDTGRVMFSSYHSSLRGLSPDVIVLDGLLRDLDADWWFEFDHALAARAEVIRP
jgi:hypothetical protein